FTESKGLLPVVQGWYADDFIQRFNRYKIKNPDSSLDLYFMPGLEYDKALLGQGTAEDWRQFYISANTFYLYGVVSASGKNDDQEISVKDLYPQSAIKVVNRNPNLSNVIERKGPGHPITTIDDLRNATRTFQEAIGIIRQNNPIKSVNRE